MIKFVEFFRGQEPFLMDVPSLHGTHMGKNCLGSPGAIMTRWAMIYIWL